jgi:hypothetical protein
MWHVGIVGFTYRLNKLKLKATCYKQPKEVKYIFILIKLVSGSVLSPETRYPDLGFHGFPQFLQVNAGIVSSQHLFHLICSISDCLTGRLKRSLSHDCTDGKGSVFLGYLPSSSSF